MSFTLPDPVIRRLPAYYRHLKELEQQEIIYISSGQLAQQMGLTASQVRQDMNSFGGEGLQGRGYPVSELRQHIEQLLGVHRPQNMIIVGAGNLGCAIARYGNFAQKRFTVIAAFDIQPIATGHLPDGLEVRHIDTLEEYVANHTVDIAVLTTPAHVAHDTASRLYACGIRGFWNFTPLDLQMPKDAAVVNVHLDESLEQLSYRMRNPSPW